VRASLQAKRNKEVSAVGQINKFTPFVDYSKNALSFYQCNCDKNEIYLGNKKGCEICKAQVLVGPELVDKVVRNEELY
jgi:hypothetical protein